jgi:hypothetical protein
VPEWEPVGWSADGRAPTTALLFLRLRIKVIEGTEYHPA